LAQLGKSRKGLRGKKNLTHCRRANTVSEVCTFLEQQQKGVSKLDWVVNESIASKVVPPDANQLVGRIAANRERHEESVLERKLKKKIKEEQNLTILEKKRPGRGECYLIALNKEKPKWVARSQIPKRFMESVEKFDTEWTPVTMK